MAGAGADWIYAVDIMCGDSGRVRRVPVIAVDAEVALHRARDRYVEEGHAGTPAAPKTFWIADVERIAPWAIGLVDEDD